MTLPTFLIVGTARAGTTTLHHWLSEHPQVRMSAVKEPKYFAFDEQPDWHGPGDQRATRTYTYDRESYQRLFDGAEQFAASGESSPWYLYSPIAAAKIRQEIPAARIIIVLRHPVDRAYSNWAINLQSGRETITDFHRALKAERNRISAAAR
jgi:hypothetical protein